MEFKLKLDSISEPVIIELEDSENAKVFLNFLKQSLRPADQVTPYGFYNYDQLYNIFLDLGNKGIERFKFNWDLSNTSQQNFNDMHKDLETFDESLYQPWTESDDDLLIKLHSSLHEVENCLAKSKNNNNSKVIRFKWWNTSIPWFTKPEFIPISAMTYGDIFVDYPHVGKSPTMCMNDNDNSILSQTCKLPDACPSGFYILFDKRHPGPAQTSVVLIQRLTEWYNKHIDQLSSMFSLEKMLSYEGKYRIGSIKNIEVLSLIESNLPSAAEIID
jgi:hypothetical protein